MPILSTAARPAAAASDPIRVMIVDDSTVIRSLVRNILADPEIEVVGTAASGTMALQTMPRARPDVIVLDIEMPGMDGISALPRLLQIDPGVKIIIASTLSQRNADISMKALTLGAADYVPKPTTAREIGAEGGFRVELLAKVRSLGARAKARRPAQPAAGTPPVSRSMAPPSPKPAEPISLRKPSLLRPRVLAIGSSTGGPQALMTLMRSLPSVIDVPIVIKIGRAHV